MTIRAVTVYTSGSSCQACTMTKRHLNRRGIPFEEVQIASDDSVLEAITFLGFRTAPIVCAATEAGEQAWDGYRPDRIDALAASKHLGTEQISRAEREATRDSITADLTNNRL